MYHDNVDVSILKGKTLWDIITTENEIIFTTTTGEKYKMYHSQDCCESVSIDDICGDIQDLVGSEILVAEEVDSDDSPEYMWKVLEHGADSVSDSGDSVTWTFYKIDTAKGGITVRWYGTSNGYYSESVDFARIE